MTHLTPFTLLPQVACAEVALASGTRDVGRAPRTGVFFVVLGILTRLPSLSDGGERRWRRARRSVFRRIRIRFGARDGHAWMRHGLDQNKVRFSMVWLGGKRLSTPATALTLGFIAE